MFLFSRTTFPPYIFSSVAAASALLGTVYTLLCREWLSAGVNACFLLIFVAAARTTSEPGDTFHDHARRALRTAGMLSAMCTLLTAASFVVPQNRVHPSPLMFVISVIFVAAIGGAVYGGGSYVAVAVLGAAWDAAVPSFKGRLQR